MCIQVYVYKQVYIFYAFIDTHTYKYICVKFIYSVRNENKFR